METESEDQHQEEPVVDELIEEISIDGMCGVY
ncbi:mycofactocin precursor MftA [Streptomyces cavernae]|nr:mycofactocin precursor MftA [Streptomyces cavernae]